VRSVVRCQFVPKKIISYVSAKYYLNWFTAGKVIICPMRQQHWIDYKISLRVCECVSESVSEWILGPPHISETVEARNFKFGTQIGNWGY